MKQALQILDMVEILEGVIAPESSAVSTDSGIITSPRSSPPLVVIRLLAAIIRAMDSGSLLKTTSDEVYRSDRLTAFL